MPILRFNRPPNVKIYFVFQFPEIISKRINNNQMFPTSIIPKQFIKNKESLSDFECMLCYELSIDTVRCKGPCHKSFCMKCISRSKTKKDRCPNRCSNKFQIEPISQLKIQFVCPYKADQCTQNIQSLQDFWKHCQNCEYIEQKAKQEMQYRKNYLCKKGHKLLFLTQDIAEQLYGIEDEDLFQKFMNSFCSYCGDQHLCASLCQICSSESEKHLYCVGCRQPPCTRRKCPIGHLFEVNHGFDYDLTCDLCGISAKLYQNKAFTDDECNFDICVNCHKKLPQQHPLVPLQNSLAKHEQIQVDNSSQSDSSDNE